MDNQIDDEGDGLNPARGMMSGCALVTLVMISCYIIYVLAWLAGGGVNR
jgi:hypothetical protein